VVAFLGSDGGGAGAEESPRRPDAVRVLALAAGQRLLDPRPCPRLVVRSRREEDAQRHLAAVPDSVGVVLRERAGRHEGSVRLRVLLELGEQPAERRHVVVVEPGPQAALEGRRGAPEP